MDYLLYCKRVQVTDENNYIERETKSKTLYISFSKTMVKIKEKKDIFAKTEKQTTINQKWRDNELHVELAVPSLLRFSSFKILIAGLLGVHVTALYFGAGINAEVDRIYDKARESSGRSKRPFSGRFPMDFTDAMKNCCRRTAAAAWL